MKIIKHGISPGSKKLKATCRNCVTKIEFLVSEAESISDQRDGDYWRVKCPICPRDITLNKQKVWHY